ncbi:kinase-like domain-containing protein [Rhizophagus diaphanus]|nr:kinase-like domain-containing protein [Rhizophagus diaphanus] [Rhizophagus sp. MUCL 43196]
MILTALRFLIRLLLGHPPWFIMYAGKVHQSSQLKNSSEALAKRPSLMRRWNTEKVFENDAISFEWESQLRFANDIASAISWLHDDMGIIHGDLHPNNILINKGTIKIADFGCSYLKGSNRNTQVQAEKADIYSLGVLFWELTSRKMPFDFETKNNDPFEIIKIKSNILKGMREKPSPGTNHKFVALYEKCWQHKPDVRPEIRQVILELNNIEPLVVSENFGSKEIETMEKSETSENDEVNVPSYDCDINKYNL